MNRKYLKLLLFLPLLFVLIILNSCSIKKTPIIIADDLTVEYDGVGHSIIATTNQPVLINYHYYGKDNSYSSDKEPVSAGIYYVYLSTISTNDFNSTEKVVTLNILLPSFSINDDNIITNYLGNDNNIEIPITYKNNIIEGIDVNAFDNHNIESIKYPMGNFIVDPILLNNIGTLKTIYITVDTILSAGIYPEYLNIEYYDNPTVLKNGKINDISGLTEFTIPESIIIIETNALINLNVNKINLPSSLSLEAVNISQQIKEVYIYNHKENSEMVIGILFGKHFIEKVTIDKTISEISFSAFKNCVSLKDINMGEITKINDSAFENCNSLISVEIPDSVVDLGISIFSNCIRLKNVILPNNLNYIGEQMFYNCISLEEIIIPDSVIEIRESAFYGCQHLDNLVIPSSVIEIKSHAFYLCSGLTKNNILNGVKIIGYLAFGKCYNLVEIIIPDSVIEISDFAFNYLYSLNKISFSDSIKVINSSIFVEVNNITDLIMRGDFDLINPFSASFTKLSKVVIYNDIIPKYFINIYNNPNYYGLVVYVKEELFNEYQELYPNIHFDIIENYI
jgi:hypothetical protein